MVKFILELCVHDKLIQSCPTLCNPVDCSPPVSSMRFSRQKSWRGLPSLPPGDLLTQGSNPHLMSPALSARFFTTETPLNLAREYSSNYNLVSVEFWSLQSAFTALGGADKFSSVAQSWPTLCNRMNCSILGFPVHYQLPESTQTHVH